MPEQLFFPFIVYALVPGVTRGLIARFTGARTRSFEMCRQLLFLGQQLSLVGLFTFPSMPHSLQLDRLSHSEQLQQRFGSGARRGRVLTGHQHVINHHIGGPVGGLAVTAASIFEPVLQQKGHDMV